MTTRLWIGQPLAIMANGAKSGIAAAGGRIEARVPAGLDVAAPMCRHNAAAARPHADL